MSKVFVVDHDRRPLDPAHPGYACWLRSHQKAAVWRRFPFTSILKEQKPEVSVQPLRLKIGPGNQTTGPVLLADVTGEVVWVAELTHRGGQVRKRLAERRAVRHSRCQRMTHYRKPRFANRRRKAGWLPPSLESRIANMLNWVARLRRLCPVGALSLELVKFDTQELQHPEISGVEYQQGTLAGCELRECFLGKWERRCAYCKAEQVPLQIEHLTPSAHGGSNRASNLTLACDPCNRAKGTKTAAEFGFPGLQARAALSLKDAAVVNATRRALYERLQGLGLPGEPGTGGLTKWNRLRRNSPKTHWLDAACVGGSTPARLHWREVAPLIITATGRHSRQMCRTNGAGFPDKAPKSTSVVGGFRTGDLARAVVPAPSKKAGVYVGRIAIRATGSCTIKTARGTVPGLHVRSCPPVYCADGYTYQYGRRAALPPQS